MSYNNTMHRVGCQGRRPSSDRAPRPLAGRSHGMGLGDLLRLEAQAEATQVVRPGKAKAVAFIFQSGGPSQH